ncbi:MAG: hypothetical protein ACKO11_01640 [Cuspidothrix sp.]
MTIPLVDEVIELNRSRFFPDFDPALTLILRQNQGQSVKTFAVLLV